MPHYANGDLALVGDVVVGTTYNVTNNIKPEQYRVGVILEITSSSDSCNAIVGWAPQVAKLGYNTFLTSFKAQDYTEVKALKKLAGSTGLLESPTSEPAVAVDVIPMAPEPAFPIPDTDSHSES